MTRARKAAGDAFLRNGRPTKQERLDKVPSTTEGSESRSKAFEHERKLLEIRKDLEDQAQKKYNELDSIFQQLHEVNDKIEHQRRKQIMSSLTLSNNSFFNTPAFMAAI